MKTVNLLTKTTTMTLNVQVGVSVDDFVFELLSLQGTLIQEGYSRPNMTKPNGMDRIRMEATKPSSTEELEMAQELCNQRHLFSFNHSLKSISDKINEKLKPELEKLKSDVRPLPWKEKRIETLEEALTEKEAMFKKLTAIQEQGENAILEWSLSHPNIITLTKTFTISE